MRHLLAAVLGTLSLLSQASHAQDRSAGSRSAPAGVTQPLARLAGPVQFGIRYQPIEWAGLRDGTTRVEPADLVVGPEAPFVVAPTRVTMFTATVSMQAGISDRVRLLAALPFHNQAMTNINGTGASFRTFAKGIGDLEVGARFVALQRPRLTAALDAAMALPTGSIDRTHTYPNPDGTLPQLPYTMQPGAGVPSFRPALTLSGGMPQIHWGARIGVTRFAGTNARGWAPGHRASVTAWGSLPLAPEVAFSMRGEWHRWGDLRGQDASPSLSPSLMPTARPDLQGGSRLDLGAGMQWLASDGLRFAAEYLLPIRQDLHGPQLARRWSVILAVEVLARR